MLYTLFIEVLFDVSGANLFRYITFRAAGALMTALLISLLAGPSIIRWLARQQGEGQPVRGDGPKSHLISKKGTPTMGGLLILMALVISTLLWADIRNPYVQIVLMVTVGFGMVGFADDMRQLMRRSSVGLPGWIKLGLEGIIALVGVYLLTLHAPVGLTDTIAVPFFKSVLIPLGGGFLLFGVFVIVGASNAVNLTDGLDGLAIVLVMIATATFGIIAYLAGNAQFAQYLNLHAMPGTGELTVFCGALVGSGLGFLWYNAPPAMVFMGDTGSLSLGGALGAISIATKHELVLAVVGGIFVLEAISVIVQVVSFKLTGRRVFLMAPVHHHFEEKGWVESTIVIRFWIIALVLALIGLSTLKLR
ncbi:MAG: phospho-N-acetylmuramoyl-pentapeptide-transferase [Parvularculales bacterium]